MSWPQPIGEYRGCTLLLYGAYAPVRYGNSCTTGLRYTIDRVKQDIDNYLGEPTPPPPPPPPEPPEEDYIEETYRGVEIWWKVSLNAYWAQVAVGYVAMWATLPEMYVSIDEILAFLEPPEEPPDGLFAQVVAAVKVWFNENIGYRLQPVYDWVDNQFVDAKGFAEDLFAGAGKVIAGVSAGLASLGANVRDRWDAFTTQTLPNILATIMAQGKDLQGTIDLKGTELEASMDAKLVEFTARVEGLFAVLDPLGFLKDPLGYISGVWNMLIDPWAHGIIKSFWEGFEEGQAE